MTFLFPNVFILDAVRSRTQCDCMEYWHCVGSGGKPYSYCSYSSKVCCFIETNALAVGLLPQPQKSGNCGTKGPNNDRDGITEPGEWAWHVSIACDFTQIGPSLIPRSDVLSLFQSRNWLRRHFWDQNIIWRNKTLKIIPLCWNHNVTIISPNIHRRHWQTCLISIRAFVFTQKCRNTTWHATDWCLKVSWTQFMPWILQGSPIINRSGKGGDPFWSARCKASSQICSILFMSEDLGVLVPKVGTVFL